MSYDNFGEFMEAKRKEKKMSFRGLAKALDHPRTAVFEIEKNKRYPPDYQRLQRMAEVFELSPEEQRLMYDLAGKARDSVPVDLLEYIRSHPCAVTGIRDARDLGASEKDWEWFSDYLKQKQEGR